jgi:hypothetical protein
VASQVFKIKIWATGSLSRNYSPTPVFEVSRYKRMKTWLKTFALVGMGALCMPVFGANPARPGTVNYIEGVANLNGKQLDEKKDVGTVSLNAGEVLSTEAGKAEILLTPGVFLRLDDHSAVKMISPGLIPTQVEIERGRAAVEVDEIYSQNVLEIFDGGVTTQLVKNGFYEFSAQPATVMVFLGKATVKTSNGNAVVKGHHEATLVQGIVNKPVKFDSRPARDVFYNWNSLRSQYLAEASNQIAGGYAGLAGFGPGWYWDPYMWNYTFIGMYPYWSPFGFGFYPPWWGGYYGGGFYGRGFYGGGGRGGFHGGGGGGHR